MRPDPFLPPLVDINAHIGGVVSGGLVASDMGDRATIGGLSKEFFTRIVKYYTDKYGADSKEFKACRDGATFEPHVAEFIFEQIVWDFDDTGKVGGEGERVVRRFDLEKVHTISLLVTDEASRKRLLSAEVPVGSTEARDITVDEFDAEMSGRWNGALPDDMVAKPLHYSDVLTNTPITIKHAAGKFR